MLKPRNTNNLDVYCLIFEKVPSTIANFLNNEAIEANNKFHPSSTHETEVVAPTTSTDTETGLGNPVTSISVASTSSRSKAAAPSKGRTVATAASTLKKRKRCRLMCHLK